MSQSNPTTFDGQNERPGPSHVVINKVTDVSGTQFSVSDNRQWYTNLGRPQRTDMARAYLERILQVIKNKDIVVQRGIMATEKIDCTQLPVYDTAMTGEGASRTQLSCYLYLFRIDCLNAALAVRRRFPAADTRIAVQNLFDRKLVGGEFTIGSDRQEESIVVRTTLYCNLSERQLYGEQNPLQSNELIYAPNVLVFSMVPGLLLPAKQWFYVDVISMPAQKYPNGIEKNQKANDKVEYRQARDRQIMKDKISYVLRAAVSKQCSRVVLSPFGCGIFGHPKKAVANLIGEVFTETDWGSLGLKQIIVAVLDDADGAPTWNTFKNELSGYAGVEIDIDGKIFAQWRYETHSS
ncbi:hypothetical protein H2200_012525 [Cladophialophora chaetospira]|uniref:Microbial-type PARG catalytic domain-containing protein n=1 Tax=Cladophialophora chaetospira TaxID=386627 RepID=A0AA39CCJ4_9EURO|nr:hypothetical protein H2200_012525 [Cladophialophora chaetospira]